MSGSLPLLTPSWQWPTRPLHLTILLLLLGQLKAAYYVTQKCYCVNSEDATIRKAVANFTNKPTTSRFEYIGATYNDTNRNFEPCVCTDVVRVVTQLAVTEPYVLQEAAHNVTFLNDNVTRALDLVAKAAFRNSSALQYSYLSSVAEYRETSDSKAIFFVEIIVKGSDATLKDKVAGVMLNAVTSASLDGVGTVDNFTADFSLRICLQKPDAGPTNTRVSPTNMMAGTTVTYTCKPGYRTNSDEASQAESKCDHQNLTWTSPTPNITCVDDTRCFVSPPSMINTIRDWDGQIEEGTEIIYRCSILDKTTTTETTTYQCQNKTWTSVSNVIKCELPTCGDPPQVPDHAVLIYNTRNEITYQCDTYAIRSGVDNMCKIYCENGTWEKLPLDFTCAGSDAVDTHQEWINFLNVTLPVTAALVFLVIVCLLCTRSDSPCCQICNGGRKEVMY